MKTTHRLWFIFAVFLLVVACRGRAHAQVWYVQPNTRPVASHDTVYQPYSTTIPWAAPSGWWADSGVTWYAIWARNSLVGCWYRPSAYTQVNTHRNNAFPYTYNCRTSGQEFLCRDIARGVDRRVTCAPSLSMSQPWLWRSQYVGSWPELGLFTVEVKRFGCNSRTLPLHSVSVSANGQQMNCAYGNPTSQGPGLTHDAWCYWY